MPYAGLDLKMGVKDIKITGVVEIAGKYYIKGENFTEYSKVTLDDEILDTLKNIDTDTLTPLEALTMLHKLVQQARHDM